MKVRVLKELPFAKVGEVVETNSQDSIFLSKRKPMDESISKAVYRLGYPCIISLIDQGWFEEVKEESLDEILHELLYQYIGTSGCLAIENRIRKHYLEVFDKLVKEDCGGYCENNGTIINIDVNNVRKALEQGE